MLIVIQSHKVVLSLGDHHSHLRNIALLLFATSPITRNHIPSLGFPTLVEDLRFSTLETNHIKQAHSLDYDI